MDSNVQNFNFLKDTVNRFKSELQKLVTTSKYSNTGIIKLRDNIEEIEKSIQNQEKFLVNSYLNNKKSISSQHKMTYNPSPLPLIRQPLPKTIGYIPDDDVYVSVKYEKQSKLDRLKQHKKKREINQEKIDFINNMKKRKPLGKIKMENMARVAAFNKEKETKSLLNKYGINSDFYDNIKVTSRMPNYMDPAKRIQYSAFNKLPKANIVLYDENNQPIIKKEELSKGLYNMINKGLIPKGADLSPAFENNGGNPMQINMRFKQDFKKKPDKDEIIIGANDNMKADMSKKGNSNDSDDFFITKPQEVINLDTNSIKPIDMISENKEMIDLEENKIDTQENMEMLEQNINMKRNPIELMNKKNKKRLLIISNFQPVKNEEYYLFYNENIDIWGQINYLLEHLGKLFKQLNLNLVEIYQDKLVSLAKDETKVIQNKDLLNCISEKDLMDKGLNPNDTLNLYITLKDRFALKIQMAFRIYQSKKKLKEMQSYFDKIKLIQHMYTSIKAKKDSKEKARALFDQRYKEWTNMQKNFMKRWEIIKNRPHYEIHINSISLNSPNDKYINTTFDHFTERENNQLNRIVNLFDSNVEIIYISPHELNNDIIIYYTSIMETFGVENPNERFHIVIPDAYKEYPPHFSVSELLLLSPKTIRNIKKKLEKEKKEAYIVPGSVSKTEVELSILLGVPILMGDLFQTEAIFTKSGSKLVFEANEVQVPVSAWDIKTEFEFFASLSHLIASFEQYNIWVIKLDNEKHGRGIAYVQLDKIQQYNELKRKKGRYEEQKDYENALAEVLRDMLPKKVKICANSLYKTWDEFFKDYLDNRGIIEPCPTYNPSSILGSPCIPIFIEPSGNIEHLPTYDKINLAYFRNIGAISPQMSFIENKNRLINGDNSSMNNSVPQLEEEKKEKEKEKSISINKGSLILNVSDINEASGNIEENKSGLTQNIDLMNNNNIINSNNINNNTNTQSELYSIAERVGKYLYKQKIIGYVTIELIVFKSNFNYNYANTNAQQVSNEISQDYWAIDLKFGLTDISSAINFSSFLYNHYYDKNNPDMNLINISLTREKLLSNEKCKIFTFPFLSHPRISDIQMKDLVKAFKLENLIYDVEKKSGTIFNFSDVLECGNLGICGILNMEDMPIGNDSFEMWKMIHDSLHIIAISVKLNEFQPLLSEDKRTDYIDIADIFNKINKHYNNLLVIEKKKKNSYYKNNSSIVK